MRRAEVIEDRRHALRDWAIPLCTIAVSAVLVTAIATERESGVEDSGRSAFLPSSPHAHGTAGHGAGAAPAHRGAAHYAAHVRTAPPPR